MTLKTVSREQAATKPAEPTETSVASILARRIALAPSDSEDESDEDSEEWD
jgi:hypothetical protein